MNAEAEKLGKILVKGTNKNMVKVILCNSGSEATEVAMKLTCQYYHEIGDFSRKFFIARDNAYHGNMLASLSLYDIPARKKPYESLFLNNFYRISSCYSYRQRLA